MSPHNLSPRSKRKRDNEHPQSSPHGAVPSVEQLPPIDRQAGWSNIGNTSSALSQLQASLASFSNTRPGLFQSGSASERQTVEQQPPSYHHVAPQSFQGQSVHQAQAPYHNVAPQTYQSPLLPHNPFGHADVGFPPLPLSGLSPYGRPDSALGCNRQLGQPCTGSCDGQQICSANCANICCNNANCAPVPCYEPDCTASECLDEHCPVTDCVSNPCYDETCPLEDQCEESSFGKIVPCSSDSCEQWMQDPHHNPQRETVDWASQHGNWLNPNSMNVQHYGDPFGFGSGFSSMPPPPPPDGAIPRCPQNWSNFDFLSGLPSSPVNDTNFDNQHNEQASIVAPTPQRAQQFRQYCPTTRGFSRNSTGSGQSSYISTPTQPDNDMASLFAEYSQQPSSEANMGLSSPSSWNGSSSEQLVDLNRQGWPLLSPTTGTESSSTTKLEQGSGTHVCKWITGLEPLLPGADKTQICGQKFPTTHELHVHLTTHSRKLAPPYCCRWHGCKRPRDQKFPQRGKLNTHLQTHSNCTSFKVFSFRFHPADVRQTHRLCVNSQVVVGRSKPRSRNKIT